jgi:hypothetical protein
MCLQAIFDNFIKLLSLLITWPAVILFIVLFFRDQIYGVIPGLANRMRCLSHGDTKVEFDPIQEVKDAMQSEPDRFSEADMEMSAALIKSAETGNLLEKAYALEALKDVAISLPRSEEGIGRISEQEINVLSLSTYLKEAFPDRIHAEPKYVSSLVRDLIRENCRYIKDIQTLIEKYSPDQYISPLDAKIGVKSSDVGAVRSLLVAKKIDEIKNTIENMPSLAELPDLRDEKPFVSAGSGIENYLIKSGNNIKIEATNVGELLEISFEELGDRLGTGLPYLNRLKDRLQLFYKYLKSKASC